MSAKALLSSARQDWRTPEWFLELVRAVGPIALDPATSPDNPTRARRFYARPPPSFARDVRHPVRDAWMGLDGLAGGWARSGLAFINPPYGAHLSGPVDPDRTILRKGEIIGRGTGWAARIAQDLGEWISLVPTRTDTEWWHRMHEACTWVVFWRSPVHGSRIQFVDPATGKAKTGSTLASSVFYRGPNALRFLETFSPHGRPVPGLGETMRLFSK